MSTQTCHVYVYNGNYFNLRVRKKLRKKLNRNRNKWINKMKITQLT